MPYILGVLLRHDRAIELRSMSNSSFVLKLDSTSGYQPIQDEFSNKYHDLYLQVSF